MTNAVSDEPRGTPEACRRLAERLGENCDILFSESHVREDMPAKVRFNLHMRPDGVPWTITVERGPVMDMGDDLR